MPACGHNVGDPCKTNVDCSPLGDRFCDTSSVNGYCTIDGCDDRSCPGEAVCIRFLTPLLDKACNSDQSTSTDNGMFPDGSKCSPDQRCAIDPTASIVVTN